MKIHGKCWVQEWIVKKWNTSQKFRLHQTGGRQAGRNLVVDFFGERQQQFTDFANMANNRHNEDYCTRALTLEYNAESGGGTTTPAPPGVGRQRHRLGPSIITPTSRSRGSCFVCCGQFFNVLLRFRGDSEELEQRYKSREIDKFLKKDKPTLRKQVSRIFC